MFAEDFSVFFNPAELGDTVTAAAGSFGCLYIDSYADPFDVAGHAPAIRMSPDDSEQIEIEEDVFIVGRGAFVAHEHKPQEDGTVIIRLEQP